MYSSVEKRIAEVFSFMPGIKAKLKWIYQYLNYFINRKDYKFKSEFDVILVSATISETYFGYYDKSPENSNGKYVIYQQPAAPTKRKPLNDHAVKVIVKNLSGTGEVIVGESTAYNWQQGTKLQWITETTFIYNFFDSVGNTFKSKLIDAATEKEIKIINFPIYDCYKDIYGLSLNYSRLDYLRPDYGYSNINERVDFKNNRNDGVFFINLRENTSRLLISLETLSKISPQKTMKEAFHKVNHLMISPDGNHFIFLHRWIVEGGKKYDRLFVSDFNGENLKILADEGMVSHCCWYNNELIVSYMRHKSHGDTFYWINTKTSDVHLMSEKLVGFGDGHPTILNNKMIFDSYPDRSRMKHLYIYDLNEDNVTEIGEFYEPLEFYGETRCDLHPRWNSDGSRIYIDSTHSGRRMLYSIILQQ